MYLTKQKNMQSINLISILCVAIRPINLELSLLLFFSPFLFPPEKKGRRNESELGKIVIKSHAFGPGRFNCFNKHSF